MKELTSFDVYCLVNEAKFLVGGKIDNIYQTDEKNIYLQIYVKDKPKQLLRINSGKYFYLAKTRPEFPENQHRFCSYLRKYILNSRISAFEQVGYERIIKLVLDAKESKYELFVELFGKGNVIVVKDNKIVAVAEEQIWADRTIKPGLEYIYPKRENTKEFFEKQKQKGSSISMESLNKELSEEMKKSAVQNSAKTKEIKKIENIIEKQSQNLKTFLEESEQSKKKGDLIYEKYQELNEILNQIKQMKGKPWDEIKKSLKKYKIFKDVNEKEGILAVDL